MTRSLCAVLYKPRRVLPPSSSLPSPSLVPRISSPHGALAWDALSLGHIERRSHECAALTLTLTLK
jgi:hypothetical protein